MASFVVGTKKHPEIKSQNARNRVWKPLHIEKIFSLGIEDGLLRPLSVKVDKIGNIYIHDFGDTCVKKFSSDGKFIQKFGKGRGQGPGEFINPTDYGIKNNGEVWICDPVIGYTTVFDINGIPIKTYRTKNPPQRIGLFSTEGFLVVPSFSFFVELPFEKYDASGKLMSIFKLPLPWETETHPHLIMDGWLSVDDEDNIYYAFIRVGLLASFSQEGNLRFLVETIDRTPPPEVKKAKYADSLVVRIDPKSPWAALSVNIVNSEIYILNHTGSINRKGMVLDVYSSFDGRYVYSCEIPQKCRFSYVTERSIFTVADEIVTKWKRYSD